MPDRWTAILLIFVASLWIDTACAAPDVPVPPGAQAAEVANRIIYNGLDMRARVFESSLPPQQVIDFYKREWGRKASVKPLASSQVVGYLDHGNFVTVQVASDGAGSKGTIGIIKLPPKNAQRPDLGKGLPLPSGAQVVNDISYPDDRTPARTVLLFDALSPSQNGSYFRSRLIADGWKDAHANKCVYEDAGCVMQFERGNSRMMFVSRQMQWHSQVLVNIQNP